MPKPPLQAWLAHSSEYLVGQVREYFLKTFLKLLSGRAFARGPLFTEKRGKLGKKGEKKKEKGEESTFSKRPNKPEGLVYATQNRASGPSRPQRLNCKCPCGTNCDSRIAERPGFESTPPTARTTMPRRTQSVLPSSAASRRETEVAATLLKMMKLL